MIHDANYRRVEAADLAAGRICRRCVRKLVRGEWIQAEGEALVHARPCKDA